ncbi:MAG: DUF4126 domain-containing protein [Chitinophagales bacterium]
MSIEPAFMYLHSMSWIHQYLIPILLGTGLSAACGLRVFLPLFILSLLTHFGNINIAENFTWLSSWPAIIVFGSASIIEIIAYYIPWLDNLLDIITIPSSVAAGILVLASTNPELESVIKWTLAIIAGGGTAGLISTATALTRAKSTVISGGATNFIVASMETLGSALLTLFSLLLPLFAGIAVIWLIYVAMKFILGRKKIA